MNFSEYKNQITAVVLTLIVAITAVLIVPQFTEDKQTIDVTGKTTVSYTPDTATFTINIEEVADTSEEAKNLVDQKILQLEDLVEEYEIDENHVQTTNYAVYPEYDYSLERNEITGYRGTQSLTVKLADIDEDQELATAFLDDATAIDTTSIYGPRYELSNYEELIEEAKQDAIKDAKDKGKDLATAAGSRLGDVISIDDNNRDFDVYPMPYASIAEDSAGVEERLPELQLGENEVEVTVKVKFELR